MNNLPTNPSLLSDLAIKVASDIIFSDNPNDNSNIDKIKNSSILLTSKTKLRDELIFTDIKNRAVKVDFSEAIIVPAVIIDNCFLDKTRAPDIVFQEGLGALKKNTVRKHIYPLNIKSENLPDGILNLTSITTNVLLSNARSSFAKKLYLLAINEDYPYIFKKQVCVKSLKLYNKLDSEDNDKAAKKACDAIYEYLDGHQDSLLQ